MRIFLERAELLLRWEKKELSGVKDVVGHGELVAWPCPATSWNNQSERVMKHIFAMCKVAAKTEF